MMETGSEGTLVNVLKQELNVITQTSLPLKITWTLIQDRYTGKKSVALWSSGNLNLGLLNSCSSLTSSLISCNEETG